MKLSCFLLLSLLLFSIIPLTDARTQGDEALISKLCEGGGTVYLDGRTYTVSDQIHIPSNTQLIGVDGTTIELAPECGIPQNEALIPLDNVENVEIRNINFVGNQEQQTYALQYDNPNHPEFSGKKPWGNQVNTFIYATNSRNITVTECDFYDNLGDGLRIAGCKYVEFSYNTGSKGGHDIFFALRSEYITAHHNNLNPLVNSGIRLLDCSHVRIYNNIIKWIGYRDAGASLQIQHDTKTMKDIEVCNNIIISSYGAGLWLVGKTQGGEELWLHHNVFVGCGLNHGISWVAGIVASGYDKAIIENNVFDGCFGSAIYFNAVNSGWGTAATAELKDNIFTNTLPRKYDGKGGYGIWNTISAQKIVSGGNCFWNNTAGDTQGTEISSTDTNSDPSGGTQSGWWKSTDVEWGWECDEVTPSDMDGIPEGLYDNDWNMTQDEIDEFEFNDIFDILEVPVTETGNIEQDKGIIRAVSPSIQTKGDAEAYIYLAGYKGEIHIGNDTYIPKPASECAMILTNTNNLASRPRGQESEVKLSDKKGNLSVKLYVDTYYDVKKYKEILGVKVPYYRTKKQHAVFTHEFKPPTVFPTFNPPRCYVRHYNGSHAIVDVPDVPGIVKVEVFLNNSSAREYRLIGEIGTAENGFKTTRYNRVSSWKFEGTQMSKSTSGLYIKEPFNIKDLKIVITTPYDKMEATDIEYTVIEDESRKFINMGSLTLVVVVLTYGRGIKKIIEKLVKAWLQKY